MNDGVKGYSGFTRTQTFSSMGTVVAGRQYEDAQPKPTNENVAEVVHRDCTRELVIPFEDRNSRVAYLRTVKDFLATELALVESQLDAEESV